MQINRLGALDTQFSPFSFCFQANGGREGYTPHQFPWLRYCLTLCRGESHHKLVARIGIYAFPHASLFIL